MNYNDIISSHNITESPKEMDYFMHTHDNYEIFGFIDGDAFYMVEGNQYHLKKGDIMLMRRSEVHCLKLRSLARYERITINFKPEILENFDPKRRLLSMFEDRPLGKFNRFSARFHPDNNWFYYLEKICQNQDVHTRLIYLLPLLKELSDAFDNIKKEDDEALQSKTFKITDYINRHLFDELSLEKICDKFYLSKSQLNRIFHRDTGSTVWNYITVKRLYYARNLLCNGEKPSIVYAKCGFNDYITFYKAYRKEFGVNPNHDCKK